MEKLLFAVLVLVTGENLENFLLHQNKELEQINENLYSKLLSLASTFQAQIQEDFFYNKQRLKSLIQEYEKEDDLLVKIFLTEEMVGYVRGLVEDANLLGGSAEGVTSKELLKVLQDVMKSTKSAKELALAKEKAVYYNQLHGVLAQKHEVVQELQVENARIYGKIETKEAEIREIKNQIEKLNERISGVKEEVGRVKDSHSVRTQELEKSFSGNPGVKFVDLQEDESQILLLQARNNENSLAIEKYNTEISVLSASFRTLSEKNLQLEQDLQQKSEFFLMNHDRFSEFSKSVRGETEKQALAVGKNEDQLNEERKDLEKYGKGLKIELEKCFVDSSTLKSLIKTKNLILDENYAELNQTEGRKKNAIEQREKEIQKFNLKYLEMTGRIAKYQKELDENMQKVSEKATEIQDLQTKVKGVRVNQKW